MKIKKIYYSFQTILEILLSKNSKLILEKVGVNKSRAGIIDVLNKMGAKIVLKNKKNHKGEKIADILGQRCPTGGLAQALDEEKHTQRQGQRGDSHRHPG